jgi:hypothetical protein
MSRGTAGVVALVVTFCIRVSFRSGVLRTVWQVKRNNYNDTRAKVKPQRQEKWAAWRTMVKAFAVAGVVFGLSAWAGIAAAATD